VGAAAARPAFCSCLAGPRVLRPCVRLPPLSPSGPSSPPSHCCTCTCTCPVTCRVGIPKPPCIYMYAHVCTCMHVCVYMDVCACMHVCVHVCMCACMHVCMQPWLLCAAVCCCSPAFVSSANDGGCWVPCGDGGLVDRRRSCIRAPGCSGRLHAACP
jgi:hypothetical protein